MPEAETQFFARYLMTDEVGPRRRRGGSTARSTDSRVWLDSIS